MKRIPIYNIILGESCGIKKMSLVEFPAVESDFLAFEKQEERYIYVKELNKYLRDNLKKYENVQINTPNEENPFIIR